MNLLIGVVTILASLANGVLVICYMPHDGHLDLPPIMQSSSYLMQDTPEMNEKSLYNSGVGKQIILNHWKIFSLKNAPIIDCSRKLFKSI